MSIQTSGTPYDQRQRLTAEQVREAAFERLPLGRRGLDETEVRAFLDRIADDIATRDAELSRLIDENRRLKHAVREWHRRQEGYDPAELLARAQQQVDAQIAQAEEYSREREEEATRLYDQIVNEARERARVEAQAELRGTKPGAGTAAPVRRGWEWSDDDWSGTGNGGRGGRSGPTGSARGPESGSLGGGRQQAYVNGLFQALDALAAHVDATRQAFMVEVDRLGGLDSPGASNAPDSPPAALASPSALGPASWSDPDISEPSVTPPRPDTAMSPPGDEDPAATPPDADDAPQAPSPPKPRAQSPRPRLSSQVIDPPDPDDEDPDSSEEP